MAGYIVGVDIGGTFTDCVVVDEQGTVTTAKSPSTPGDFAQGMIDAIALAADKLGCAVSQFYQQITLLAHGTTRRGVGYAYTSSNVSESTGNGTAHENAGFVYGQFPVGQFVVDGVGSYGASSTDTQRADPLGGALLQSNGVIYSVDRVLMPR